MVPEASKNFGDCIKGCFFFCYKTTPKQKLLQTTYMIAMQVCNHNMIDVIETHFSSAFVEMGQGSCKRRWGIHEHPSLTRFKKQTCIVVLCREGIPHTHDSNRKSSH